jgi:hypothetical protein
MKRFVAGLALAAALLGSSFAGTALAQESNPPMQYDSRGDQNAPRDHNAPQNPGDSWRQDAYQNPNTGDNSRNSWGRRRDRSANATFEGRWVADNRSTNYRPDRSRGRGGMGALLPEFIRIDQRPSMVRISDRRNQTLEEIMVGSRFDPRNGSNSDRQGYLIGRWRGSTLVVESTGPRGAAMTQSFALEDRGRTLVVRTRREGRGPRGTMEFSTVYRRA